MYFSVKGQEAKTAINFINIHNKGFDSWYGPFPGIARYRFIQFGYESHLHGWGRIVFYPKTLKEIKKIDSLEKSNKYNDSWVRPYILRNQDKFNIWMVFVDKAYDKDKSDAGDLIVFEPTYPCKAELFKLEKQDWIFVKSEQIMKNESQFKLFPSVSY
jgi:hypothetical protein